MFYRMTTPVVFLVATTSSFAGNPPDANISWEVSDQTSVKFPVSGEWEDEKAGIARYVGELTDPFDRWAVQWDYTIDYEFSQNPAEITGSMTVSNLDSQASEYSFQLTAPIEIKVPMATTLGGTNSTSLTLNMGGGQIACATPADPVLAFLIDGQPADTLHSCPFVLMSTGESSMSTSTSFGVPFPQNGHAGPELSQSIGISLDFFLTDGDEVEFTSGLMLTSGPSADINGDGVVDNSDLQLILAMWGPCQKCAADLNNDGEVDGNDLGILFGMWTGSIPRFF